jgi:hypothetical protein
LGEVFYFTNRRRAERISHAIGNICAPSGGFCAWDARRYCVICFDFSLQTVFDFCFDFFLAHQRTGYWRSTAARDTGARTVTLICLLFCSGFALAERERTNWGFKQGDDGFFIVALLLLRTN